jgi:hypothetical protein
MPAKYNLCFPCAQAGRNFAFNREGCEPVGESDYGFSLITLDQVLNDITMTTNQVAFSLLRGY